jgi:hypothetical protein
MKTKFAMLVALLAAALALPSLAAAPERRSGWLLLAQSEGRATCELDGRKVPQGMTYCRGDGYVWKCNRQGSWERTSKAC